MTISHKDTDEFIEELGVSPKFRSFTKDSPKKDSPKKDSPKFSFRNKNPSIEFKSSPIKNRRNANSELELDLNEILGPPLMKKYDDYVKQEK